MDADRFPADVAFPPLPDLELASPPPALLNTLDPAFFADLPLLPLPSPSPSPPASPRHRPPQALRHAPHPPKPPDAPPPDAPPPHLPKPPAVAPPRLRARPVVYKSRALERTAPRLVAAASSELMSAAASIRSANLQAERVRDQFKADKEAEIVQARAEAGDSNAEKYERRLRLNRHSAAASRIRRDAYTKALEAELIKMERSFRAFVQQMNSTRAAPPAAAAAAAAAHDATREQFDPLQLAEPPDEVVDDIVSYIMPSLSHRRDAL